MDIRDALAKAAASGDIAGLHGFFLSSAFSIAEGERSFATWTLTYVNREKNALVDATVNENVALGEPEAIPHEAVRLDTAMVRVSAAQAAATARQGVAKKIVNTLATLHTVENRVVWTIGVVCVDLTAVKTVIDAASGAVLSTESMSLLSQ